LGTAGRTHLGRDSRREDVVRVLIEYFYVGENDRWEEMRMDMIQIPEKEEEMVVISGKPLILVG
jgi:hypothetical protein